MRTKVLLCAAALAASLASSMAQSNVYSLNVVGYYNVTIGAHQKVMIANQLNTTNNTVAALLAPPSIGNNDAVFKFAAGGFTGFTYSTDLGMFDPDASAVTMNPDEAVFFVNAQSTAETVTFVGEVEQGSLTNTLPLGIKVLRSSIVPQAGMVDTTFGVVPDNNDSLFIYNPLENNGGYSGFTYSTDLGGWDPAEPTINVGEGFFYVKAANGAPANTNWVRNFTVQ